MRASAKEDKKISKEFKKQKRKAKETLEILTPVAHRLGIYKIKSELEDLSLRYSNPTAYFDIVEKLNIKKSERDDAVGKMLNEVSVLLKEHNITHEIKGRSKSIYSIYNKMAKGKKFEDIYDILALRVFVETEQECYTIIGLIHSKYKPSGDQPDAINKLVDGIKSGKENQVLLGATGTGKTLNALQLALDNKDKKILYLTPYNSIIEHVRKIMADVVKEHPEVNFNNVQFYTYNSISKMSDEELKEVLSLRL